MRRISGLFGLWVKTDTSLSYLLLLLIMVAFGCNTREGAAPGKKDQKKEAAEGTSFQRNPEKLDKDKSDSGQGGSGDATGRFSVSAPTSASDDRARIVRNDQKEQFLATVSLPGHISRQYHVRELLVSPFYDELFQCGRMARQFRGATQFRVLFKVIDSRRVIFEKVEFEDKGTHPPALPLSKQGGRQCLVNLYQNAVVEVANPVPFVAFYLDFDFRK